MMAGQDNEATTRVGNNVSCLDNETKWWCIGFTAVAGLAAGIWVDVELLNDHLPSFDCSEWCNKDVDYAGNPISSADEQHPTNYGPKAAAENAGYCDLNFKWLCFPLAYIFCKILPNVGVPVGVAGAGASAAYLSCLLAEKIFNSPSQVQRENQSESPLLIDANVQGSGESNQQSDGAAGGEEAQLLVPASVIRTRVYRRFNMSDPSPQQGYGTADGETAEPQVTQPVTP